MGDPLSVTASVLTVVASGITIAKGLYRIADTMGSAGHEVRFYATEIQLLTNVLENISDQLHKKAKRSWSRAERIIMDILDACNTVLDPMSTIQATMDLLLVRFKDSPKKFRQVNARVWWFFKYKEKVHYYRQCLQHLNTALSAQLAAMKMDVADGVSHTLNIHLSSLQLRVAEAERLLQDRTQLQLGADNFATTRAITGQTSSPRRSIISMNRTPHSTPGSSSNSNVYETNSEVSFGQGDTTPGRSNDLSQAMILYPGAGEEIDENEDGLSDVELAEVQNTILDTVDDPNNGSDQEIREELRSVLRKVVRYAIEIRDAPAQSLQSENERFKLVLQPAHTENENQHAGTSHFPVSSRPVSVSYSSSTPTQAPSENARTPDRRTAPPTKIPITTGRTATSVHSAEVSHSETGQDDEPRISSLVDGTVPANRKDPNPQDPAPINDKFIMLRHIDGSEYQFPYEAVRRWEVSPAQPPPISQLIAHISQDAKVGLLSMKWPKPLKIAPWDARDLSLPDRHDEYGHLLTGDYTIEPAYLFEKDLFSLKGPDGQNIIPRFWANVIQPGWTVALQLTDEVKWPRKSLPVPAQVQLAFKSFDGKGKSEINDHGIEVVTSRGKPNDADLGIKKLSRFFKMGR